jgi:predicted transcriptional regulator
MSAEEELKEVSEHAKAPFEKTVAATMAIIAAALAVVSVLAQHAVTEQLLNQQKASDQWAYYQAKSIRRYQSEVAHDMLLTIKGDAAKEAASKFSDAAKKYRDDGEKIQDVARDFEKESKLEGSKSLQLHYAEIFLEIALVFGSLAILIKAPLLRWVSVACLVIGIVTALTMLLVR